MLEAYWKSENICKVELLWGREMETDSQIHLSLSTILEYSGVDKVKFVCQTLQVCPIARFVTTLWRVLVPSSCLWSTKIFISSGMQSYLGHRALLTIDVPNYIINNNLNDTLLLLINWLGLSLSDALQPLVNPVKMKRRLLYLNTQFVPRCKHFSSRL